MAATAVAVSLALAGPLAGSASALEQVAASAAPAPTAGGAWQQVRPVPAWGGLLGTVVRADEQTDVSLALGHDVPAGTGSLVVQVHVLTAVTAGTVTMWSKGATEPAAPTVSFSRGISSATTLVTTDASGGVSLRSSISARIALTVVGYVSGNASTPVGIGGTAVTSSHTVLDQATGAGGTVPALGAASTVPVAGLGEVPVEGARAVWLSVQTQGLGNGTLSFSGAAVVAYTPTWSTSLVLAALDQDGSFTYTLRGSATSGLRIAVVGWLAGQSSDVVRAPLDGGIVAVPARSLTSSSSANGTRALSVSGAGVPTSAKAALLQVSVRAGALPGLLLSGSTAARTLLGSAGGAFVPGLATTTFTIVAPLNKGQTFLLAPVGAAITGTTLTGYQSGPVAASADTVAPTLTVTTPSQDATINQADFPELTIAGTAADAGSGVKEVTVSVAGDVVGTAEMAGNGHWQITTPAPVGHTTLAIRATDWAGRTTTVPRTITIEAPQAGRVVVAPETHVLAPAEQDGLLSLTEDTVVFQGIAPLVAGDVVASGITDVAPDGMLRRVFSVERLGDTSIVHTAPAEFTDALLDAHVHLTDIVLDGSQQTMPDQGGSPGSSGRFATSALSGLLASPGDGMATFTVAPEPLSNAEGTLTVGIEATLGVSFEFELDIDLVANWHEQSAHLNTVTFAMSTMTQLSVEAKAIAPIVDFRKVKSFPKLAIPLGGVTIPIGPVPLVLKFELQPGIYAKFAAEAGLVTRYDVTLMNRSGMTYHDDHWTVINEHSSSGTPTAAIQVEVVYGGGLNFRFLVKVYDVLDGPFIDLGVGVERWVTIDVTRRTVTDVKNIVLNLAVGYILSIYIEVGPVHFPPYKLVNWRQELGEILIPFASDTYPFDPANTDPSDGGGDPGDGGGDPGDGGGDPGDGGGDPGDGGTGTGSDGTPLTDVALQVCLPAYQWTTSAAAVSETATNEAQTAVGYEALGLSSMVTDPDSRGTTVSADISGLSGDDSIDSIYLFWDLGPDTLWPQAAYEKMGQDETGRWQVTLNSLQEAAAAEGRGNFSIISRVGTFIHYPGDPIDVRGVSVKVDFLRPTHANESRCANRTGENVADGLPGTPGLHWDAFGWDSVQLSLEASMVPVGTARVSATCNAADSSSPVEVAMDEQDTYVRWTSRFETTELPTPAFVGTLPVTSAASRSCVAVAHGEDDEVLATFPVVGGVINATYEVWGAS
ncbi:hypothetical protein [Cellulomonas sp. URHE0023]|uniref:hypothetical protein n=1 Tax=Cellulomonas sp. URHE0023 TaxID=1380354 RepID=UPI0012DBFED7|nr:hypothetical protein [Cellulomonas sp. URHE0023]